MGFDVQMTAAELSEFLKRGHSAFSLQSSGDHNRSSAFVSHSPEILERRFPAVKHRVTRNGGLD
jgi:hypothetical protein